MSFDAHTISANWRTRPADERYTSLTDLQASMHHVRTHSASKVVPSKSITAETDGEQLVVRGPSGAQALPSHWAFGQLAARAGAPAGYLRDLPAALAADCINYGLHVARDVEDVSVLLYQNGGPTELHAVNGPNYGRIWNARVVDAMVEAFGDGRTGTFRVPGEFGNRATPITKENTTLYASDRDMVCMLADESKAIPVHNRRDGRTGNMSTGIVVGNSDVGGGKLWVAGFAFDYLCCNRIIWGMCDLDQLAIRHTSSAPIRFAAEVVPALKEFASSNVSLSGALIAAAQNKKIDDLEKFLKSRRFTGAQVSGIKAAYKTDESLELGANSASIWDAVVGITAYARGIQYQDARVGLEREAGKILQLAA